MKSLSFLTFAALAALGLASCQQDGLVENVDPHNLKFETTEVLNSALGTFEFDEQVFLTVSLIHDDRKSQEQISLQPQLAITGFGSSEIENIGSWDVDLDLTYNPESDGIYGTVTFDFPDYGDHVVFTVYGGPAMITRIEDGQRTEQLAMQLAIIRGTGRFADAVFEGTAILDSVDGLYSGRFQPNLVVDGLITTDGE